MKLLHILATPRNHTSNTLRISNALLEELRGKVVDCDIDFLDLFNQELPSVVGDNIEAKYNLMTGEPIDQRYQQSWKQLEFLIEHFLAADVYLLSVPMWNFSIPYALKYYIDAIVQPNYLFQYDEEGKAIGMVRGKKMIVVTTRGGDYSENSPFHAYDFQEPYLRSIFGFVGIRDIHFINAQPMDVTRELRERAIKVAIENARQLVANTSWQLDADGDHTVNPVELKPRPLND